MKLTRPRRRRLYLSGYTALAIIGLWLFWGPMPNGFSMTTSAPSFKRTEHRMHFGVFQVMRIATYKEFDSAGILMSQRREWNWHSVRLALSAVATVVMVTLIPLAYRRSMSDHRLTGQCDECGYDLTGLLSDRCPECGVTIGEIP